MSGRTSEANPAARKAAAIVSARGSGDDSAGYRPMSSNPGTGAE